jgi:hypothetical protein
MIATEKDAGKKLCHLTIGSDHIGNCVGSQCMAWRKVDQIGIGPNGEKRDRDMDGRTQWVDRGHCGLVSTQKDSGNG